MPPEETSPLQRRPALRCARWTALLLAAMAVAAWLGLAFWTQRARSVTLPDGLVVTYFNSSCGALRPAPPHASPWARPSYVHSAPSGDQRLQRWWQSLRATLPGWLVMRLPAWDSHPDVFPDWPEMHELELQFRVSGNLAPHQWDVFVADEKGWETRVRDYIWGDDGRAERGAPQHSGWIRLGSAYPRHSQQISIRFRPSADSRMPPSTTELQLRNPFHEGPARSSGERLPITKPFRDGMVTLEELARDPVVGDGHGALHLVFSLARNGQAMEDCSVRELEITDSSGQWFRKTSGSVSPNQGRLALTTDTAPWSDDPSWHVTLSLHRDDYSRDATEGEKFLFQKLPAPGNAPIAETWEAARNGITLRVSGITAMQNSEARFTVGGWAEADPRHRVIVIHDARDDQGRTHATLRPGQTTRLVGGPVGGSSKGTVFAVRLPEGAKWWNLTLLAESVTTVKFNPRAPLPR